MRNVLVRTLALLLLCLPGPYAHAQTLDDAIDAELDEVSAGDSPSTAPKSKSNAVDDIQLDDGGGNVETAPQTAKATPQKAATPADSAGPNPDLVDDELKLDDEPTSTQAEAPKTDTPDIELDGDSAPQEVAKPSDEAPDLNVDEPAVVDAKPEEVPMDVPTETPATTPPQKVASGSLVTIDSGNEAYEKKLSQYSRGYKQVPDVNWDEIVGERRQENYRLQRGDTLWDISGTFFGDGFFWAKLWSQNGVIGNPHKILKGHGIRFVAGTDADAPAIAVVDQNKNISTNPISDPNFEAPDYREQAEGQITQEEIERGDIETNELIPAPSLPSAKKRAPVLKNLPNSIPETHVRLDAGYDASGLKALPPRQANVAPNIFVNSMILDGKPNEIGRIDEIETQERVAGTGQAVFLNANRELSAGDRVTFIKMRSRPSGAAGPVVDVQGIGVVDGVIKENTNTYRVTITTALSPVEKGALAIFEAPPLIKVTREGRRSDVHVRVVGGEYDDERRVIGAPSVVYLNGGAQAGIHKGDLLGVEAKRGTRRDTRYPLLGRTIAIVKVADVREKVATAVVVQSIDGIAVGDMTGGDWPEEMPTFHRESADEAASKFGRNEPSVEN